MYWKAIYCLSLNNIANKKSIQVRMEKLLLRFAFVLALGTTVYSCIEPSERMETPADEWFAGGTQTIFTTGSGAFSTASPTLNANRSKVHGTGDAAFGSTFVSAPAPINPGLGPIFNNVSCTSCHISDGRGKPPLNGDQN